MKDRQRGPMLQHNVPRGFDLAFDLFQSAEQLASIQLAEALKNEELRKAIQSNSYYHPLGFLKVVLARDQLNKREIRLNIWHGEKAELRRGNIHSHSWDLHSRVLHGRLQVEYFDIARMSASVSVHSLYRCTPYCYETDHYTYTGLGRVNVLTNSKYVISQGESYRLPRGAFHLSHPLSTNAVTLMVQQRPRQYHSYVVQECGDRKSLISEGRVANPSEILDGLQLGQRCLEDTRMPYGDQLDFNEPDADVL